MHPDNGPPDGNFAAYVESLNRARQTSTSSSSTPGSSMPAVGSAADDADPEQNRQALITDLRRELGPLIRFAIIAFLLLGIAGALGPPYSTVARVAALVIAVYVIRRAMVRTAGIRAKVHEQIKKARR